jgi:hypothetical protein
MIGLLECWRALFLKFLDDWIVGLLESSVPEVIGKLYTSNY